MCMRESSTSSCLSLLAHFCNSCFLCRRSDSIINPVSFWLLSSLPEAKHTDNLIRLSLWELFTDIMHSLNQALKG